MIVITGLALLPAVSSAATTYTLTPISPGAGNDFSSAFAINNNGLIAGMVSNVNLSVAVQDATLEGILINGSNETVLPGAQTASDGTSRSIPYAINDSNEAVGETTLTSGNGPFSYSNGVVTNLSPAIESALGITATKTTGAALGINNSGVIVGSIGGNSPGAAFVDNNGVITTVGNLGGAKTELYNINNSGIAVGTSELASGDLHAVTFDGTLNDLGAPTGDTNSIGFGIDSAGEVVGVAANFSLASSPAPPSGITGTVALALAFASKGEAFPLGFVPGVEAVSYNPATKSWTTLGTLGGSSSEATAINDSGTIVGASTTASDATDAFVDTNGVMADLNSLIPVGSGWQLIEANDINNAGDIVGIGTCDGDFEGFLLSPGGTISGTGGNGGNGNSGGSSGGSSGVTAVPLPPAVWPGMILLSGLLGVGAVRSRRVAK